MLRGVVGFRLVGGALSVVEVLADLREADGEFGRYRVETLDEQAAFIEEFRRLGAT